MARAPRAKTTLRVKILLIVISILFTLLIAELALQVAEHGERDPLGWSRHTPSAFPKEVEDTPGTFRLINVTFLDHGFRRWPTDTAGKRRVLIVGDSFTEMVYVNASEAWYARLEREYPESAFFVYGVGGYGTLQEAMAMREYIDEVKPDVVIWQSYFNDYSNNYWPADRSEYPLNNLEVRPYLEHDKIVYRYPMPLSGLRLHSALAREVLPLYDRIAHDRALAEGDPFWHRAYGDKFWERDFSEALLWHGHFADAERATSRSYAMAREMLGDIPIYELSADDRLHVSEEHVAAENNITYISGVPTMLADAQARGETVLVTNDRHWNKVGNMLVGGYLAEYFEDKGVLGKRIVID